MRKLHLLRTAAWDFAMPFRAPCLTLSGHLAYRLGRQTFSLVSPKGMVELILRLGVIVQNWDEAAATISRMRHMAIDKPGAE